MSANIPVLAYASRHTQVVREHDRTVINVPPDTHWFSWLPLGLIAVLGLACLVLTCWPAGATRTRYGEIRFPHGAPARIAALTVAVICLASARAAWRIRSGVTSLTVNGNTLTRSMPSIFGVRETSYDLAEWEDAGVELAGSDSTSLWLYGSDGRAMTPLLHTDHYRQSDLERAADALREEMARSKA